LNKLAREPHLRFLNGWWQSTSPRRYGFATFAVAAAAALRYALGVYVGLTPPFALFYPAVVIVCLYAGLGPSVFATFLSLGVAEALFVSHTSAVPFERAQQFVIPAVFCALGVLTGVILDAARRRAEQALRVREDRYHDLVEHSEDLLCTHDLEGNLLTVNPAPARILGYSVEELLKIPMRNLIVPEGRALFEQYLERLRTTGQPEHGLLCVICKSGEVRTWEYHNTLRTEGVDKPIVRGMAHDITERRRAELALQESEQRERARAQELQTILDTLPIPVLIAHDPRCLNVSANRAGYEHFDAPPGSNLSLLLPENAKRMRFRRGAVRIERDQLPMVLTITTGIPARMVPMTLMLADGTEKHQLLNAAPLLDQHGKARGAVAAALDVTEQVRAEAALRTSEEHFRLLVEQAPNGIFLVDSQGKYLDVNSAGAEMLGYARDEILRLSIADMVAPEEIERIPRELQALIEKGTLRSEWKVRRKDGSFFPGEVSGRRLSDGRLQGILCDISDRKRAEEILRQSEERFRVALKDSPIAVFTQDCDLRYTWIYNPQFGSQQDILGKTDDDLLGPEKARPLRELKQKVIDSANGLRQEVVVRQNGHALSFDIALEPLFDPGGKVVGITGACMDIARLRELADRLEYDKQKLIREKSYLEKEVGEELGFAGMVGQSPALQEVLSKARVVAPTDSTVLLLGETGTGKELVARSIHALSARGNNSFIKLNCAAVPTGLLESELFGHEKGAFTGAVTQKMGRLELADKGTLLLDEVGELPLELQPKLLRVLQDREFERLGGVRTLHVDVRIIAATNRDLKAAVADRKFREDLFYRLNVFPIELPPLRQRRGDIGKLVHHFVAKYSSRMGKHIQAIPEETMSVLENWNWPGNVRELENMIERMVILTKGRVLAPPPVELYSPQALLDESLSEMDRGHIMRVLRETNGVLAGADGAASRLGIKRTTLQSMLKRLHIRLEDFRNGTGTLGPA
jgi:formate hydrogenlyase transcriptional activator